MDICNIHAKELGVLGDAIPWPHILPILSGHPPLNIGTIAGQLPVQGGFQHFSNANPPA